MEFVRGSVTSVDPERKVAQILELQSQQARYEQYDYLIAASGLRRVFPTVPQSLRREDFLSEAKSHRKSVLDAQEGVVIVGGGAVGVEMAAEIKEIDPNQKVTLIHSRDRLLSAEPLPDDFKDRVCDVLRETGIEVILGQRVVDHKAVETSEERRTWNLTLADGTQLKTGHVMSAISKCVPTSTYLPQDALDQDGYVHIHPTYALLSLLVFLGLTQIAANSKTTSPTQSITSPSVTLLPGPGSNVAAVLCSTATMPPRTPTSSCCPNALVASLSLCPFRSHRQ